MNNVLERLVVATQKRCPFISVVFDESDARDGGDGSMMMGACEKSSDDFFRSDHHCDLWDIVPKCTVHIRIFCIFPTYSRSI